VSRPAWSIEPDRFLKRFWFFTDVPGLRAIVEPGLKSPITYSL
jgi:hypothetical protein